MGIRKVGHAGVLALLGFAGMACSTNHPSKDAAALDRAYKAGVLTEAEYRTKKVALESQATALEALDKALAGGVLTNDEYLAKKSALLASDAALPVSPASPLLASAAPIASEPPAPPEVAAAPVQAASSTPSSFAQGHVLRMKVAKAIDPSGFGQPMVSASMLIPTDWQAQGGTTWNIKDKCNTISTELRASGPDGRGVEVFPTFSWVWADDPSALRATAAQTAQFGSHPCDVMPPMSATDFIRKSLNRVRPNAQFVGFEQAPKLLAQVQQMARQQEQAAARYNLRERVQVDLIKARVRYSLNGHAVEEWIIASTVVTGTLGPSMNPRTGQMGQAYRYNCTAYAIAERAPQGQLDASERLLETVATSFHVDPQWQAKVTGVAQNVQQTELKGVRDRSNIVTKNAEEMRNIQRQGYENAQRTQDHAADQWSQATRGLETYRNPATGETVELSNLYGQAWVNNRGEYLLSDQPGFDPSVTFKEDWKPLERVNK